MMDPTMEYVMSHGKHADELTIILKGHLIIEYMIDKIINAKFSKPKNILKYNFYKKIEILYSLDLIPKYIISETNINIIDQQGETQSVPVNGQNQMGLNFKSQFLEVTIKAGVNFEIQKSRTLNQVIALMKVSPMFAQLINTKGLMILIDNLDIRGSERLKALSKEFIEQQQQSPPPPNPAIMEQQNIQKQLQNEQEQNQVNNKLKAGELALKKESNDTDRLKVMTDLEQSRNEHLLTQEKVSTEQAGQAVQMAIKAADIFRKHDREDRESDKS